MPQVENKSYPPLQCLGNEQAVRLSFLLTEMFSAERKSDVDASAKAIYFVRKMGKLGIPFDTVHFAMMNTLLSTIRGDETVEEKYNNAAQQLLRFLSDEEEDSDIL